MKRRVVITGLGVLTPIGNNVKDFWNALKEGRSGIGRITKFDVSSDEFPVKIAGEIKNFKPEERIESRSLKRMDLFTQYTLYATMEAIADAKIEVDKINKDRVGVIIASGIGGVNVWEEQHKRLLNMGASRVNPMFIPMLIINTAPGTIAIHYGFRGPNFSVVSACASSGHAIGESMRKIQYGEADVVITGGAEAPLTPLALAGFSVLRALSKRNDEPEKASRPFDRDRDGFVMAEGCGILILEEIEHAKKRGARIYAEIAGYGASDDAYHITAPDESAEGPSIAMKNALDDAGINPEEIEYINAHGTSTELNDKIETKAIKKTFGEYAKKIPISSTKSMTGHLLGAASAVEAVATVLSIYNNYVHPTINYENPDPECDLDYVPNKGRDMEVNAAISNSFGFGGHNVAIVFKKYKE
uniref:3-oxoacyl-[acyl-carrier-protein] synthase 2 n=1 Tax=candidate division WOR-3 bacterium TaxID=2052148 RepID=A0A7C4Y979_UNCW3